MEIKLKNLAKRYEGNIEYTLENINLEIKSGEFIALLGPSGCGKTTLLRMIAGLNSITKGELIFGSTKVNNLEPKDRDIAMVFQSYALYPHLSVYKNMAYSLRIKKVKKEQIDQRVRSVAKILQIESILFNKPSEISGGQRQRVALGRAIVRKPSIFLMDEPLSNLDAKLRENMRVDIVKIHKLVNSTTIYVTHDQLEAMTMADKIVLFNDKKIQQFGTPTELYNYPANLFVANFIGSPSMNFIDLQKEKNNFVTQSQQLKIKSTLLKIKDVSSYNNLVMGIRPENLTLETKKPNAFHLEAVVIVSEILGKETTVIVEYEAQKHIKVMVHKQIKLPLGKKVFITIDFQKIHLFDPQTTNRLAV